MLKQYDESIIPAGYNLWIRLLITSGLVIGFVAIFVLLYSFITSVVTGISTFKLLIGAIFIPLSLSADVFFLWKAALGLRTILFWQRLQDRSNFMKSRDIKLVLFKPSKKDLKKNLGKISSENRSRYLHYYQNYLFLIDNEEQIKAIHILHGMRDEAILRVLARQEGIRVVTESFSSETNISTPNNARPDEWE